MDSLEPYSFFFELPLYAKIKVTEDNYASFHELISFSESVDAYSPSLKENTTYRCVQNPNAHETFEAWTKPGSFTLECKRTGERILFYVYWDAEDSILQKIGQYPSIATLNISKIKQYNKVLDKERIKEFTRAIGLAANGVGIGSFVYLRRIFEMLISEAFQKAKAEQHITDEAFANVRMADRIELLRDYLPNFLVENRNLYSILSVGLHSLKENQCLEYFEAVKVGIELILDEKVEEQEKKAKVEAAKKRLESVQSKLSQKP